MRAADGALVYQDAGGHLSYAYPDGTSAPDHLTPRPMPITPTRGLYRGVCARGKYRTRAYQDGNLAKLHLEQHLASKADRPDGHPHTGTIATV